MSAIAGEVSLGSEDAPEFPDKGSDEIASLAQSFNRMRRSLTNAMRMLDT
jgi:protein-histidine pros-kinase